MRSAMPIDFGYTVMVLFETAAGFALFELLDTQKLYQVEDLSEEFSTPESARKIVELKAFCKCDNMLEEALSLINGKVTVNLEEFLEAHFKGHMLAVEDYDLAFDIYEKLDMKCINTPVLELMRGLRTQLPHLISTLNNTTHDLLPMSLGLAHRIAQHKLHESTPDNKIADIEEAPDEVPVTEEKQSNDKTEVVAAPKFYEKDRKGSRLHPPKVQSCNSDADAAKKNKEWKHAEAEKKRKKPRQKERKRRKVKLEG